MKNINLNQLYEKLEQIQKCLETQQTSSANKWLTGKEVQKALNIGARTLQNYRDLGKIGFSQIGKKVILYRTADVEELINNNFNEPFKSM